MEQRIFVGAFGAFQHSLLDWKYLSCFLRLVVVIVPVVVPPRVVKENFKTMLFLLPAHGF
jgi:hypothetical protein